MLEIPATRAKLAEAEFFFRKLCEVNNAVFPPEPEAFSYYLSAFVSAARSVNFVLQAEHKCEYDAWFTNWRAALPTKQRNLLKHFNAKRVAAIHKKEELGLSAKNKKFRRPSSFSLRQWKVHRSRYRPVYRVHPNLASVGQFPHSVSAVSRPRSSRLRTITCDSSGNWWLHSAIITPTPRPHLLKRLLSRASGGV